MADRLRSRSLSSTLLSFRATYRCDYKQVLLAETNFRRSYTASRRSIIVLHMLKTVEKFADSVIDTVHAIWLRDREEYRAGYAVFYSPTRLRPELMVIGLNPGGDRTCFSGNKEPLVSADSPMEYITYRDDRSYPLAGKTAALFESIGLLNILAASLKTNVNFFRSKKWTDLPQQHSAECLRLVLEMIEFFRPKAILCESIRVFDLLYPRVVGADQSSTVRTERSQSGRRIYTSVACGTSGESAILIGITHLTGSRPSSADLDKIKQLLVDDLGRTIAYSRRVDARS